MKWFWCTLLWVIVLVPVIWLLPEAPPSQGPAGTVFSTPAADWLRS